MKISREPVLTCGKRLLRFTSALGGSADLTPTPSPSQREGVILAVSSAFGVNRESAFFAKTPASGVLRTKNMIVSEFLSLLEERERG